MTAIQIIFMLNYLCGDMFRLMFQHCRR